MKNKSQNQNTVQTYSTLKGFNMEKNIMKNENINNREQWLLSATDELKALFKQAGETVPNDVKVSCGFPLGFRAGSKHQAIGVCHPRSHSESGVNEIFINPNQDDSLRVLDVLVHELIHAIDDCQSGHGAPFRKIALAVGLTGKMTATVASPELEEKLKVILEKLGEYPHAKIQAVKKKQSTRMIKHVCENDCGAIIYASRKQSEENPMMCANCSGYKGKTQILNSYDEWTEYNEVYMVEA